MGSSPGGRRQICKSSLCCESTAGTRQVCTGSPYLACRGAQFWHSGRLPLPVRWFDLSSRDSCLCCDGLQQPPEIHTDVLCRGAWFTCSSISMERTGPRVE